MAPRLAQPTPRPGVLHVDGGECADAVLDDDGLSCGAKDVHDGRTHNATSDGSHCFMVYERCDLHH